MKFFIGQAVTGEDINNLYIELEKNVIEYEDSNDLIKQLSEVDL